MRLSLLALPLAALCGTPSETLTYAPELEPGLRVTSHQRGTLERTSEEVEVTVAGEEQPTDGRPSLDLSLEIEESLVFVDTFARADDAGLPVRIERTFEELAGRLVQKVTGLPDGFDAPEPVDLVSALEGETVVLERDDEGLWTASAGEDSSVDEDVLETVEQNSDLAYLLPEGEVSVGDTWELDAEALRKLLNLAGEIDLDPEDDEGPQAPEFEQEWSADGFRVELTELDGGRAVLRLVVEARRVEEGEGTIELPEGADMEPPTLILRDVLTWELEGEAIWSTKEHRALSVRLAGSLERELDRTQEFEAPMGTVVVHEVQAFEGEFELTATFERVADEE